MLLVNERKKLEGLNTPYNKYYVPFIWASTLVARSRKDGLVKDNFGLHCIIDVSLSYLLFSMFLLKHVSIEYRLL